MQDRIFVDTSWWYELAARRAPKHAEAAQLFRGGAYRLVTTTDVLKETVTLVQARDGHRAARAIGSLIRDPDFAHLVRVEEEYDREAWDLFQARPDKGYSLTDCTSFMVMRRLDLDTALTFDQHFGQEGFRILPRSKA